MFILLGATWDPDSAIDEWIAILGILAAVAFVAHFLVQVRFVIFVCVFRV